MSVGMAGAGDLPDASSIRNDAMILVINPEDAESPPDWVHEDGYLFIDGEYIPLQTELQFRSGRLTRRQGARADGLAGSVLRPADQAMLSRIQNALRDNGVVIVTNGKPALVASASNGGYEIIEALVKGPWSNTNGTAEQPVPQPNADLRRLLVTGVESEEFYYRALADLDRSQVVATRNQESAAATARLSSWSYPLTIMGMVSVVLAFGHLLTVKPNVDVSCPATAPPYRSCPVVYSAGLIVVMAILDLAWTGLAHQANAMFEVNPLGHRVISHGPLLMATKLGLTLTVSAILVATRQHPAASRIAWWGCLIMALATARWIMFTGLTV